jgi:hypothetical protein
MGTQQSRSGHGREGSRQQSQQSDHRPQQDRDLQRNKQSDRGEHEHQGNRDGQQKQGGTPGSQQQGQQPETQQSQLGGGRDFDHKMENEGREQNREQQNQRRQMSQTDVHGEGNYAASRQYNDATKDFTQSGRVEPAARAAAPHSDVDAREMAAAEAEGKRHAKGEDPALNRTSGQQPAESSRTPRPGQDEE